MAKNKLYLSYGGTFDPVHHGHLAVARSAAEQLGAVVHLVPCADPPHRARPRAAAIDRAEMLRLAIADDPRLALDLREIERGGTSYTVDTLRELRAQLGPQQAMACLIGADAFCGLPSWHEWRELFTLAHLVSLTRPGHALEALPAALDHEIAHRRVTAAEALCAAPAAFVLMLQVPSWPVSSTAIRTALAVRRSVAAWVPAAVCDYIAQRGLYR